MSACRKPCPSCPWRVDQHADVIPGFKLELAEGLVSTTINGVDENGRLPPVFACHQSTPDQEVVCVGWLARYGWDSLAVRLRMSDGKIRPEELEIGDDWPELHETFDEVITKLRDDMA